MALKYFFEYNDLENVPFRCEISNDDYFGLPIEIRGYCVLEYPRVEHIYTVIRGGGMRINLEANSDLTLEDLYSDDEKANRVTLVRDGFLTIFRGFVDPSGLFEDLVNDVWMVQLDCIDGLALLDNLSYVDENGNPFTGKSRDIDVISRCLKRTGVFDDDGEELVVRTSIGTRYNGLARELCPLGHTYSNQERFYRDDGETIDSCKSVLESTLRKYGGAICLVNGRYEIFSFYDLLTGDRLFYRYKSGNLLSFGTTDYRTNIIGEDVNDAPLYWVNANQRKEIIPPVGAVRVNYKYGFVRSLVENPSFNHNGSSIENWTILNNSGLTLEPGGFYVEIDTGSNETEILESNAFDLSEGDLIVIQFQFFYDLITAFFLDFKFKLEITDGTQTYYLQGNNQWSTTEQLHRSNQLALSAKSLNTYNISPEPIPISGEVRLTIVRSRTYTNTNESISVPLIFRNVSITGQTDENLQGEIHTQQVSGRNTRVEDVIEVSVGDNPSDIYLGALYKSDTVTNTDLWFRWNFPNDIVGTQSILEILSEQISVYRKNPSYMVSGDVYGFFDFMSLAEMTLVPNRVFMMSSYSYDTRLNTISCEWKELRRSSYFGNSYEFSFDYGNVVKPTIVG